MSTKSRPLSQPRPAHISFPGLARADGSAEFRFGPTGAHALCSIAGPLEVRLSAEHPAHATFDVLLRPLSGVPSTSAKARAAAVRALLEPALVLTQHPRTLVQLVGQCLSSGWDDAALAAVANAGTLALLNAGSVPMKGVVCAVALGRTRAAPHGLVVDPEGPPDALSASGCFAFLFASYLPAPEGAGAPKVADYPPPSVCVWADMRAVPGGPPMLFSEREMQEAKEMARGAAGEVWKAVKASVERMGKGGGGLLPTETEGMLEDDAKDDDEDGESGDDDDDDKMEI